MSIVPGRDIPAVPAEWVDAVNKAINDAMHEDLCACDGWPDACRSYKPDQWDTGVSLDIAVGVLEPLIRERIAAESSEPPRTEWANRLELRGESEIVPVGPKREGGGEEGARERMRFPWHTALLKRTVTYGPWIEVPVEKEMNDG